MRKKKQALVVTFNTTVAAMEAENYFEEHGVEGRLGPIPPSIKAGCGLAWIAPPGEKEEMEKDLKAAGINYHEMHSMEV